MIFISDKRWAKWREKSSIFKLTREKLRWKRIQVWDSKFLRFWELSKRDSDKRIGSKWPTKFDKSINDSEKKGEFGFVTVEKMDSISVEIHRRVIAMLVGRNGKRHAINPASDNGAVLNTGCRSRSPIRGLGRAVASRELDHLVCYAQLENGCSVRHVTRHVGTRLCNVT